MEGGWRVGGRGGAGREAATAKNEEARSEWPVLFEQSWKEGRAAGASV
jgi:hypothetical protein